jgi:hypothetical protein
MRNLHITLYFLFANFGLLQAQKLPATQLFLFNISETNGKYSLGQARWLNQFNPKGYNNQPYFVNDDELYVTVQMPWDTTQTDIYSLNLKTKVFLQITDTKESEYSAKLMPSADEFSVVRVDATPEKTQRLWRYPVNRLGRGVEVFKYQQGVGYYHWLSPSKAMMFIVDKPFNRMCITEVGTESATRFEFLPGRSFATLADGSVACIEKPNDFDWYIKKMDLKTYNAEYLTKTPPNSEDFVVTENGTFLMGSGPYLYQFRPQKDKDWVEIANLSDYGIRKIERLALNKKGQIVMVTK